MSSNEQLIATFQTRVRDMLHRFRQLRQENEELRTTIVQREADIRQLRAQLTQATNDYNALKTARMLEITSGDVEKAKARVARLIREVDKSIAILNDEPQEPRD